MAFSGGKTIPQTKINRKKCFNSIKSQCKSRVEEVSLVPNQNQKLIEIDR